MNQRQRLQHWLGRRNLSYMSGRLVALLRRYGVTARKAEHRVRDCVQLLAQYGCAPTFPTPGRVVDRNPEFCRDVQAMGAELAVHGYDHVDFSSLSHQEAHAQFERAAQAFVSNGIQFAGFRCPYLSYSDETRAALPKGAYLYSSNKAIWWDVIPTDSFDRAGAVFDNLYDFYKADSAASELAVPSLSNGLVEIPVSIPDDLQLYDGLNLGVSGIGEAWSEILSATHRRGEFFVLLFHPESFSQCADAFSQVLDEASQLEPAVWVTRLQDVDTWWREKANFRVEIDSRAEETQLHLDCSERATVLVRNLDMEDSAEWSSAWYGAYRVSTKRSYTLQAGLRPFLGIVPDVPDETVRFLREQGYILDTSEHAAECGICLDAATLTSLSSPRQLIVYIESTDVPLIRFWRWPHAYRSALSVTGDLDAVSLRDYAARLLPW